VDSRAFLNDAGDKARLLLMVLSSLRDGLLIVGSCKRSNSIFEQCQF